MKKHIHTAFVLMLLVAVATGVQAATRTWDGGGVDAKWSTKENWSGDVVPQDGDDLIFPAGAARLANTNDVLATVGNLRIDGTGYQLQGAGLTITNGITCGLNVSSQFALPLTTTTAQTFSSANGNLTYAAPIQIGGTLTLLGGRHTVGAVVSGPGGIAVDGVAFVAFNTDNTFSGGLTVISGAARANDPDGGTPGTGTGSVTITGGAIFGGLGTSGNITVTNGTLRPGASVATNLDLATGDIVMCPAPTCDFRTTVLATTAENLVVKGTVALNGAKLNIDNIIPPASGTTFRIIDNDGNDPIGGTFGGLPEGSQVFSLTLNSFTITYAGGDGNDVVLTATSADLGVTLTASNPAPVVGDSITFTARVANVGPDATTNTSLSVPIPAGFSLVSVTPGQGACNSAVDCTLGTIAQGNFVDVNIVAKVLQSGPRTIRATAKAIETDPGSANNSAEVQVTATGGTAVWDGGGADALWSTAENWVGDFAPFTGDNLVFPAGAARLDNTNPVGNVNVYGNIRIEASGYVLRGSGVVLTGGVTAANASGSSTIALEVVVPQSQAFDSGPGQLRFTGPVIIDGPASELTLLGSGGLFFDGAVSGEGRVIVAMASGQVDFNQDNTFQGGLEIREGVAVINDPAGGTPASGTGAVTMTGPALVFVQGGGSLGALTANDGSIEPGTLPDLDLTTGTLVLGPSSQLVAEIVSPTEARHLEVIGGVTINNALIALSLSEALRRGGPASLASAIGAPGVPITLVDNDGVDPIVGTFRNLPEGSTVSSLGQSYRVSYKGGTGNDLTVTAVAADLSVTKTTPTPFVEDGQDVAFTITVSNAGPDQATGVVLTDTPSVGFTFVSASLPPGACTGTGPVVCTIGTIDAGSSVPVTIVAKITGAISLTNVAEVTGNETDPVAGNNTASAAVSVDADVSVTKVVDIPSPSLGQDVTFTLTVSNAGPAAARGVTLFDTLPAGLLFVSATPDQGTCSGTAPVTCALGTIAKDGAAHVTIVATTATNGRLTNTATVTVDANDRNTANNTASAAVEALADLSITKSANVPSPAVGQDVTFTITVSNAGPSLVSNVEVVDTLPAGLTFVSATSAQGVCNGTGPVACTIPSLTPGGTAQVTVVAKVDASGALTNNATVIGDETDPNTANNSASATVGALADVSVRKTANAAAPAVGQDVTYTITVSNAGPSPAGGVTLTDALPAGLRFVSATPDQGTCSGTSTVTCALGTIGSGSAARVTLVATVLTPGVITNTARATANVADLTPGNDSASAAITARAAGAADVPALDPRALAALAVLLVLAAALVLRR